MRLIPRDFLREDLAVRAKLVIPALAACPAVEP